MTQWIAFDEYTAANLETRIGMKALARTGDALDSALSCDKSVLLLPTENGEVLVAAFGRSVSDPVEAESTHTHDSYAAGGFLGLSDEVVVEEEPQPKKHWWEKLLD